MDHLDNVELSPAFIGEEICLLVGLCISLVGIICITYGVAFLYTIS